MCFFVTSYPCIVILVIRADLFYVKQCCIPETSPRSLGWNTGRSGFSEPGCHKQGPAQRFLFRLRPCVNLFYCLLLFASSGYSIQPRRMPTYWHVATSGYGMYLDTRGLLLRALFSRHMLSRPNTLGSVRRREFGLICISSESCLWSYVGFSRLPCFGTLCSSISAKVALGELLRLCPGSSG